MQRLFFDLFSEKTLTFCMHRAKIKGQQGETVQRSPPSSVKNNRP